VWRAELPFVEQKTPEVSRDPLDALGPFTETELCKPVALKLILKQLAEIRDTNRTLHSQLQTERNQNDALAGRANRAETALSILQAAVRLNDRRGRIVHLIEFAMVILISFMIDATKSSSWTTLVGLGIACLALLGAVAFIQWWPSKPENQ
jgi:hypothetical protein